VHNQKLRLINIKELAKGPHPERGRFELESVFQASSVFCLLRLNFEQKQKLLNEGLLGRSVLGWFLVECCGWVEGELKEGKGSRKHQR